MTAVPKETIENAGIRTVSDAAVYSPNTFFSEFTARKLSFPRFRGIGPGPNNPGVTTYIDGVPQLSANSSSIELIDVDQIEFVRGPRSALYGRNTLGGLVNVVSAQPSRTKWTHSLVGLFGDFSSGDARATVSGPVIANKLAVGVGVGYSRREGYTRNDVTGHDLDSRSAFFGKGQVLWTPNPAWQARIIFTGERARDGDYGLQDLAALRAAPFHAARDLEGYTHRDVVAPTVHVSHTGESVEISSITGFVRWKTRDLTDLDYTPLPLITRDNSEKDFQFSEEIRFAPAKNASLALSDNVAFKWQAGLFFFTRSYEQDAVNGFAPYLLSPFLGFPVSQHSPQSTLDGHGLGVYGQGTVTFGRKLDVTVGLRGDREHQHGNLNTFYVPAIAPASPVNAEKDSSDVSPQFTGAYRFAKGRIAYVTAARGFKAGGFNAASPSGSEAYGVEHSWNYEAGVKTSWFAERLSANGAAFVIDWSAMQVSVPNPAVPAQFYIANVGSARSKGIEVELVARPVPSLDVFGAIGYTDAHFLSGARSSGVDVSGKLLSSTPRYTGNVGAQYSVPAFGSRTVYGRAEVALTGSYKYDDANTAGQDAYSRATFRAGVRDKRVFAEAWIRNAFDTRYVPLAFAYGGLAPSGFIGELGAPRTFGVRAGVTF